MRLRDMVRVKKKDLGNFIGVDAELSVVSVVTLPYSAGGKSRLDLYEEARDIALKQIDEDVFGEARHAFDVFTYEIIRHISEASVGDAEVFSDLVDKALRVRQILSIYGGR